jgi:hypothetical protein
MFDLLRPAARMLARRGSPAIALVTAAAFAACSDSTASRAAGGSQLGFTTTSSSTSSAPGALASVAPITKNGHTIDLTQVTVVIDHAQLKRANTDACSGDDDEHDAKWGGHVESCASARVAPTLVDLPLDGKVVTLPMNALPAGTFREIELRISLARLVGTFDGSTFDVTIPVETKAEIEFATPLVVSDTAGTSITVNLPIADWLTNADGSLVDPRQLLTDQKLLAAVRSRIMASLKAFEDNDHDGKSDHDRGGHD